MLRKRSTYIQTPPFRDSCRHLCPVSCCMRTDKGVFIPVSFLAKVWKEKTSCTSTKGSILCAHPKTGSQHPSQADYLINRRAACNQMQPFVFNYVYPFSGGTYSYITIWYGVVGLHVVWKLFALLALCGCGMYVIRVCVYVPQCQQLINCVA